MALRYEKGLFGENPIYDVYTFENRSEWLNGRNSLKGIGGSDASAALAMNPWRTNRDLWLIKTGRKNTPDISNNKAVRYGSLCEEYIRRQYQLDVEEKYEVHYAENVILQNKDHPYMLYSPDGLLKEKNTNRNGVLEIKTSTIQRSSDREKWDHQIPQNYYIQIVHGLNVTGFDFAELRVSLKYSDELTMLKTFHVERSEITSDIDYELKKVSEFWEFVEQDKEPPLIIAGL